MPCKDANVVAENHDKYPRFPFDHELYKPVQPSSAAVILEEAGFFDRGRRPWKSMLVLEHFESDGA